MARLTNIRKYLPKHEIIVQIDNISKIDLSTVTKVVTSIVPPKSTPLNYKAIEEGFVLSFINDKDINAFYNPDNLYKLKQYNLSPTLTPLSMINREVYVPGVTRHIYYLPKHEIIAEIKQKTNID